MSCTLMTAHERYVFTFIQSDSWKRGNVVSLPLKLNYLAHIYVSCYFFNM
jgi:hypothetical protein